MAEYDECFLIYDMDSDVPFYGFDEVEFKKNEQQTNNATDPTQQNSGEDYNSDAHADQPRHDNEHRHGTYNLFEDDASYLRQSFSRERCACRNSIPETTQRMRSQYARAVSTTTK
ncbi:hypothetical protein DPMN_043083 [Dreissena polymorpha]|uniref:Uncharacterized protein n=1 Tax=Dreissena polymorpha TaxID=45954 RepID=A0A9D4CZT6_DREPO|nr:hypothetical protein DPMN_043083 [Dreissena polymorpha]